ncbi:unnamed protein product, partial [marine sediment metagenome]
RLGKLTGKLKDIEHGEIDNLLFDFSLLNQAAEELRKKGIETWY